MVTDFAGIVNGSYYRGEWRGDEEYHIKKPKKKSWLCCCCKSSLESEKTRSGKKCVNDAKQEFVDDFVQQFLDENFLGMTKNIAEIIWNIMYCEVEPKINYIASP